MIKFSCNLGGMPVFLSPARVSSTEGMMRLRSTKKTSKQNYGAKRLKTQRY